MHTTARRLIFLTMLVLVSRVSLFAQPPTPPPPAAGPWVATASAGLALTTGNSETSTLNLGYDTVYDPKGRNLVRSSGLFLRAKSSGDLTANRLALDGRDEYRFHSQAFVFGQLQYVRDTFKDIDYLVAPAAGVGFRFRDTPSTKVSADIGVGGVWEKDPVGMLQQSGLVTASDHVSQQLSSSAAVTQSLSVLYKMDDFRDALYTASAALAASVTARTQLKLEVIDTYKNLVVAPVKKNDVAVIVGLVFKR